MMVKKVYIFFVRYNYLCKNYLKMASKYVIGLLMWIFLSSTIYLLGVIVIELLIRAGYQPFGVPIRGLENPDQDDPDITNVQNPGEEVPDVENQNPGNLRLGDIAQ